jgi:hypothetical protein
MDLFTDPYAVQPGMSYDAQLERAKRQRAMIERLRNQEVPTQSGQMVGKWYVPNRGAQLVPALSSIAGSFMGHGQDKADAARDAAMQQDAEAWMGARPQTQQVEVPGPPEEGQVGPLTRSRPPTQQDNLQWAQQGQKNPLTRALAAKYGEDILIKEPEREEARDFRRSEAALNRQMRADEQIQRLTFQRDQLGQQMEVARQRSEDRNADVAARTAAQEAQRALQLQIAQMNAAIREAQIQAQRDIAAARVAASKGKGGSDKPLPSAVMKNLQGLEAQAEGLSSVSSTFKPEFGGPMGYIDKVSGTWNPFSGKGSEEAATWWKNYENQAALVERHEKFGTALSAGERAAWQSATIAPGMKAETIKANLAKRAEIAEALYERSRQEHIRGGYGKVREAFQSRSKVRKNVGGKEYYQVDGKWYTDEDEE